MDDAILLLEKEYCPPIDTALFSAIVSDYDLSDPLEIEQIRPILDALKESADAEGTADFDPSGSSGQHYATSNHESPDRARSWHGEEASRSEETDVTSLSRSTEMLGVEPFTGSETEEHEGQNWKDYDKGLEELSPVDKEDQLKEMFPTMKAFDISYALKKNKDNFGRTVEELLNHVFFREAQETDGNGHIVTKGIDAFTDGANGTGGRKARAKRRKQIKLHRRTSSTPALLADKPTNSSFPSSTSPGLGKWDQAKCDVEFITQRTYLSPQTVSSQYHKSNASLPATISALCASSSSSPLFQNPYLTSSHSPTISLHASELAADFPSIPSSQIQALINLTHPSKASAHDLALAMISSTPTPTPHQLIPLYKPPNLSLSSSPPSQPRSPLPHPTTTTTTTTTTSTPLLSHPTALALASHHKTTHTTASAQATASHRASRSQPLMSGATSYYSQRARDSAASAAHYRAAAADALVAQQSGEEEVDLHGVRVGDAVRIARERVLAWWVRRRGAEWRGTRRGAANDARFRIVTGWGRHSEGGRGRLGPAVGGMLVREGWKVEVGTGWLVVMGRAGRR